MIIIKTILDKLANITIQKKFFSMFLRYTLICSVIIAFQCAHTFANVLLKQGDSFKFVYIVDLNLIPTPITLKKDSNKTINEKGIMFNESNSILIDLISHINNKLKPDYVFFGGNNISNVLDPNLGSYWSYFLDIVSSLKSSVCFVFGENERKVLNEYELVSALHKNNLSKDSKTWWSIKVKKYFFIGLDSSILNYSNFYSSEQINWLNNELANNKNTPTIVFLHKPLLDLDGKPYDNPSYKKLFKIISLNPQIKSVISGSDFITRTFLINGCYFILSPSPVVYPCRYYFVELLENKILFNELEIPLKGIVKKSSKILIESYWAEEYNPNCKKCIKKYVLKPNHQQRFSLSY